MKVMINVSALLFVFIAGSICFGNEEHDTKKQRIIQEKIRSSTGGSFVIVRYYFKKSERPHLPEEDDGDEHLDNILLKKPLEIPGVLISSAGEVFIPEPRIRPDFIDRITVTGPDAVTLQAEEDRILANAPGQIIRISGTLPQNWKPLNFVKGPDTLVMDTKLYSAVLMLGRESSFSGLRYCFLKDDDEEEHLDITQCLPVRSRKSNGEFPDYFNVPNYYKSASVICDSNGLVLGVTSHNKIETGEAAIAWRGDDIKADTGINRLTGEKSVEEQFAKFLLEVTFTFRPPPKEDDEYSMEGMSYWGRYWGGGDEDKEIVIYGLAIEPNKVLLPVAMSQDLVAGIDTITVQVGQDKIEGNFAGVLKHIEGMIVQITEPKITEVVNIDPNVILDRGEFFWAVTAREIAGKDVVVDYNRWIRREKGFENKLYRVVEDEIRNGSWLLDRQGRFAGLFTSSRRDFQRILPYLTGSESYWRSSSRYLLERFSRYSSMYYGESGEQSLIFDNSKLRPVLLDLSANYDNFIRRMTRDEQKRRVWLGVEFAAINKEMAKQLNIRRQTQDGRIGLMVNRVYQNSPAQKIGLVEGDVLLKLNVPDAPWPIELKLDDDYDYL